MDDLKINDLTVREHLLRLAAEGNRKFTESLHPGVEHILGIRVPDLRNLARQIAKNDWELFLERADKKFVWVIESWSECDVFQFAGGKAYFRKHQERIWEYLKEWLKSSREFEVRFGVVRMMEYYVDGDHLDEMFACFEQIRQEGYYVKMGVAWALSVCFVKFPERTMEYLKHSSLDSNTYNKTLRKIIESNRVPADTKDLIRKMKRVG